MSQNLPQNAAELAARIDQTNLKPEATQAEMEVFLQGVRRLRFATAAILPLWAPLAAGILEGSGVAVDPAIGFPLGTQSTTQKAAEARWCVHHSGPCAELDMVMNLSLFKTGRYHAVEQDIRAVVDAAQGLPLKVIIEVSLLTQEEVAIASLLAARAGAQYIKTSTGFRGYQGWRATTPDDVRLIRAAVGDSVKVKAAGGMTSLERAWACLEAGADRIGSAYGVEILEGYRALHS